MVQKSEHPAEARLLAALSHASAILQGLGILVGIIVYSNQREKSRYAAFQALQAAVYQVISMLGVVAMWFGWTFCYFATFIPIMQTMEGNEAPPPLFWISMGSMLIPMVVMIILGLYGLVGALATWQGKDFRYILVGGWLDRMGLWKDGE